MSSPPGPDIKKKKKKRKQKKHSYQSNANIYFYIFYLNVSRNEMLILQKFSIPHDLFESHWYGVESAKVAQYLNTSSSVDLEVTLAQHDEEVEGAVVIKHVEVVLNMNNTTPFVVVLLDDPRYCQIQVHGENLYLLHKDDSGMRLD